MKSKIKQLVSSEDPKKPFDQKLVDMLKADGVTIARRTVASIAREYSTQLKTKEGMVISQGKRQAAGAGFPKIYADHRILGCACNRSQSRCFE